MARATKPGVIPDAAVAELHQLRGIVGLAAFAAESRRILQGIAIARRAAPDMDERLCAMVEGIDQWEVPPDELGGVLEEVHFRLSQLLDAKG